MPVPFDQISIINLRSRADRRCEMMGELDRLGLKNDPRVEFFEAGGPANRDRWRTVARMTDVRASLGHTKFRNTRNKGTNIPGFEERWIS